MIVKMIQYFQKRMEAQIKKIQRNIKHTNICIIGVQKGE